MVTILIVLKKLCFFQNVEPKTEKQIYAIFLFQFKLGCKAAETARDINQVFGIGTTTEHTVQWWFKKFHADDESLKDDKCSGQPSNVDNDQLKALVKVVLVKMLTKTTRPSIPPIYSCYCCAICSCFQNIFSVYTFFNKVQSQT